MSAGEVMLTDRLKSCTWRLVERQTQQFARGGASAVIQIGEPYWLIDLVYENLGATEFRALSAWLARRRGALVTFSAFRADRPHPANITAEPVATITSQDVSTIRVQAGPDLVGVGDMISYNAVSGGRFIGEVTNVVATGAGYADVNTVPLPPTPHGTPVVQLVPAVGLFRLEPSSVRITEVYEPKKRVSFTARQDEP